jgi:hypothetical protein
MSPSRLQPATQNNLYRPYGARTPIKSLLRADALGYVCFALRAPGYANSRSVRTPTPQLRSGRPLSATFADRVGRLTYSMRPSPPSQRINIATYWAGSSIMGVA